MLADGQVGSQRPDARSVTGRGRGRRRKDGPGGASTPTAPALDDVLGDHKAELGEVGLLAALGVDHVRIVQAGATRGA
jgi:hypothetical protein